MIAVFHRHGSRWFLLVVFFAAAAPIAAQDPARVRVATPEVARFGERFALTGTLTAERAANLSPLVDGLVESVRVDAGDEVVQGDVLLELDATMAGHALARARAASAEAAAGVAEARRLFEEARRVGERNFIPATLVATREAELQLADAVLASRQAAEREQAELRARHSLPAPFAGVIAGRETESGEWVQRGTPVLRLVATDRVRLDLQVPQERWAAINDDTEVSVHPDALPGVALPARIAARVPVTDPGARTFLLRVVVEAGEHRLLPGTSARAEIALPVTEASLAVPRDALLRQPNGGFSLYVVEDAGDGRMLARQRTVGVLRDQGEQVAVGTGLAIGERIVVRGNEALRDGLPVRVVED
jgi:RND family efflux transporter MFP subunit